MQKDFHYSVIRILAEKAGFPAHEAQIIAYASQFVDDATVHKPIPLPLNVKFEFERIKNHVFDPICTAHKGLQFLNDFKIDVQMKIYSCFHFLPPEEYTGQENYDYVTKPNSNLAKALITNAKNNFVNNPDNRTYNLIALGIALHTYSDTWAHQGFSGRHSSDDNDVTKIKITSGKKWKTISTLSKLRNTMLPEIGHAEAYEYPDFPYQTWQYKNSSKVIRNNLSIFIDAVENIYAFLSEIAHRKHVRLYNFKGRLVKALSFESENLKKRVNMYKKIFPEIGFHYDENEWKDEVFCVKDKFLVYQIKKQEKSYKWFVFHKAALEQRRFLLPKIKPL